jgi:pimeloyl-ACP methyl ester carboxylesterase
MRLLVEGTAGRAIVLFGAESDPAPDLTWARGVTLMAGAAGQASSELDHTGPVGVVGWSDGGPAALAFAARHPAVDRLALIATPIPETEEDLTEVTAKTLLIFGSKDPLTGSRHGTWWQKHLPSARLEMHPDGGHDLLVPMWPRILSHLAPRCKRTT